MNNSAKFDAYKSFYEQAKNAYANGDIDSARELFLKAASLANEISLESTSYDVRMEYHNIAAKIINFVKTECIKKTSNPISSSNEEIKTFIPETNDNNKITFDDVAGLQDVKDQIIYNVLEPLKNPELAKMYNISPGAKIVLYGPPGTGKTFIARAIAGEVDAAFYSINCQDLISKYMGDSSKMLDKLFNDAEQNERAIIFFDEFDSVASKREDSTGGVDAEMARFVATFLTKVDGFKKSNKCKMLLLIATTNRPWAIDPAMLRGGRFDTLIYVELPDYDARMFLINKVLNGIKLEEDVSLEELSNKLEGFGGGDVTSICNKIKNETYRRATKFGNVFLPISNDDINKVLENSRASISSEELAKFILFKEGISF